MVNESKTSVYYVCSGCGSFHEQKLGRVVEKTSEQTGAVNLHYKTAAGPPVDAACPECGFSMRVRVVSSVAVWACGCVDALYVACRSDVVRSVAQPRVRCQSRRACRSTRENLRDVDAYEGDVGRRPRGPSHCCNLSSLMDGTICITL